MTMLPKTSKHVNLKKYIKVKSQNLYYIENLYNHLEEVICCSCDHILKDYNNYTQSTNHETGLNTIVFALPVLTVSLVMPVIQQILLVEQDTNGYVASIYTTRRGQFPTPRISNYYVRNRSLYFLFLN